MAQNALFFDDAGIVLDVERIGNRIGERADIILAARFIVNALGDQHINECDYVDFAVRHKELLHSKIDLLMLLEIKILGVEQVCHLCDGDGIDQDRSQERLLCRHGERQAFHQFILHTLIFQRER